MKKTTKTSEEIVHIDRLTKYKNAVPPQWRKEVEREKEELNRADAKESGVVSTESAENETGPTELVEAIEPPLGEVQNGESSLEILDESRVGTRERPSETEEGSNEPTYTRKPCGEQLLNGEQADPSICDVPLDTGSNTLDARGQLIPDTERQLVGSEPDRTHVAEQDGMVEPMG